MRNWFISDTHWGHNNVITYSERPFRAERIGDTIVADGVAHPISPDYPVDKQIEYHSVNWMNETLIKNWNDSIKPEDKVYFLGDFAFSGGNKIKEVLARLNGYKILIKGNHDRSAKQMLSFGFNEVHDTLTLKIGDEEVIMSHYPYVDLDLSEAAKLRPNVLKFTDDPKVKLMTIPPHLDYQEGRDWLAKHYRYPINTTVDGSKEHVIKMQRLISRYIGTRLVNEGKILLHGHTHNKAKRFANMINLSVEAWDYKPASEEEIIHLINDYKSEISGDKLTVDNANDLVYEYYRKFETKNHTLGLYKEVSELSHLYAMVKYYQEAANNPDTVARYQKEGEELVFKVGSVPRNYSKKWYETAVNLKGFIPMDKLEHGKFYTGYCRNAKWAYWDGATKEFYYIRYKFGSEFVESIQPVEKDDGFDLFVAHREYSPTDEEVTKFWQLK